MRLLVASLKGGSGKSTLSFNLAVWLAHRGPLRLYDLDPQATPVDGCDAVSRQPPAKGADTLIEEKFVVPADAVPSLSVRLSFASTRPDALSLPLGLK